MLHFNNAGRVKSASLSASAEDEAVGASGDGGCGLTMGAAVGGFNEACALLAVLGVNL